jgi:hypothetical protein
MSGNLIFNKIRSYEAGCQLAGTARGGNAWIRLFPIGPEEFHPLLIASMGRAVPEIDLLRTRSASSMITIFVDGTNINA